MTNKMKLIATAVLCCLVACEKSTPTAPPAAVTEMRISIPDYLSRERKDLAAAAWPKVRAACQGLDKYSADLQIVRIDENLHLPTKALSIEFFIPESTKNIPGSYMAGGHHCFLDINADGTELRIAKSACKAVCLDKPVEGTELETGDDLVVRLQ